MELRAKQFKNNMYAPCERDVNERQNGRIGEHDIGRQRGHRLSLEKKFLQRQNKTDTFSLAKQDHLSSSTPRHHARSHTIDDVHQRRSQFSCASPNQRRSFCISNLENQNRKLAFLMDQTTPRRRNKVVTHTNEEYGYPLDWSRQALPFANSRSGSETEDPGHSDLDLATGYHSSDLDLPPGYKNTRRASRESINSYHESHFTDSLKGRRRSLSVGLSRRHNSPGQSLNGSLFHIEGICQPGVFEHSDIESEDSKTDFGHGHDCSLPNRRRSMTQALRRRLSKRFGDDSSYLSGNSNRSERTSVEETEYDSQAYADKTEHDSRSYNFLGWEDHYQKLETARKNGDTLEVERCVQNLKKRQRVHDGDRSHKHLAQLDALELSYPQWEDDVQRLEELHFSLLESESYRFREEFELVRCKQQASLNMARLDTVHVNKATEKLLEIKNIHLDDVEVNLAQEKLTEIKNIHVDTVRVNQARDKLMEIVNKYSKDTRSE